MANPPEQLGVFEGPAHVLTATNDPRWLEQVGKPLTEFQLQGPFYDYLRMIMDRVYMTGKRERVDVVAGSYTVSRWVDGKKKGCSVLVERCAYPKHVPILMATRETEEVDAS